MKTYRFHKDIAICEKETENDAIKIMDSKIAKAIKDEATVANLFNIDENPFTSSELTDILEITRVAIKSNPDALGDVLDLSDDYLDELLSKIEEVSQ